MSPRTLGILLLAAPLALAACGGGADGPTGTPFVIIGVPDDGSSPTRRPAVTAAGDEPGGSDGAAPGGELVSLDWLAGGGAYPAVPSSFAPLSPDNGLRHAVADALQGRDGKYSVIVRNLADGRYAELNPDAVYYAASLFKAAVLLEAYRQRDAGVLDFAKEVEVTEEAAENDLGTLEFLEIEIGDRISVADAVKAMIIVSDTTLANLVLEEIGYPSVDATLLEIGASTMTVSDRDLPTTASDMAALIGAIATGDGVTEESREEMLSWLSQEWFAEGIVAGIPAGTAYAHKTGSYTDATHDVAIVDSPAGPYLIAVLTDRSYEWEPIAELSVAVWQYFAGSP